MHGYRTRDELRNLVIQLFSREKEIYAIYIFGKEVSQQVDEYSDIDMIICSKDLAATQSKYRRLFNEISPMIGTFLLNSTENDFSQMVMMGDFSPYQKIDFSITDRIETKIAAGFGPFTAVYQDDSEIAAGNARLDIITPKRARNQLDNYLFAIPRFTKCLFRNDPDMYRRWKNISDAVLVLLYEKHFGWEEKTSRNALSVMEWTELKGVVSAKEEEKLHTIFPPSGQVNLAESFESCMELLVFLCRQKALFFKDEIDEGFIRYMVEFLCSEVLRYGERMR